MEKYDAGILSTKGRIAFMFQDFQLFPHMTVRENIMYAPILELKLNKFFGKYLINSQELGESHQEDGKNQQITQIDKGAKLFHNFVFAKKVLTNWLGVKHKIANLYKDARISLQTQSMLGDNIAHQAVQEEREEKDQLDAIEAIHTWINSLLHKLGILDKAAYYPHQLSGGQKQRVALARSLAIKPDYLLCDEPTSGLDIELICDVIALLQSVQGMTMLIASHDDAFLQEMTEDIIYLYQGQIIVPSHNAKAKPLSKKNKIGG